MNARSSVVEEERPIIGRFVVVAHAGRCYVANVIDKVAGTNQPKRVRIQRDAELQGKVLMPGEYTFKQFADGED